MQSQVLGSSGSQVHVAVCVLLVHVLVHIAVCVVLVRFPSVKWLHSETWHSRILVRI